MKFLFIKGDRPQDVRMSKYIRCLSSKGYSVSFWGWDRLAIGESMQGLDECRYVYRGGGFRNKVFLRYPIWMIRLFFAVLFSRHLRDREIIAVNFDAALPVCIASCLRGFSFTYEILDEFAISYRFPNFLKKILKHIDHWIIRKSKLVIHVDSNRISYAPEKCVVIENSPEDYWQGKPRSHDKMTAKFAVVGCLSAGRGMSSICEFARRNPLRKIMVVGNLCDKEIKSMLQDLPNVECFGFMPQSELFRLMEACCGIFSLYDPSLEINRLAASNKVYDAMMMGIPVITNKEVLNSRHIEEQGVGIVLDYKYNNSWGRLTGDGFLEVAKEIGSRGRRLYLEQFQFPKMIENRLIPALLRMKGKK